MASLSPGMMEGLTLLKKFLMGWFLKMSPCFTALSPSTQWDQSALLFLENLEVWRSKA